MKPFEERFWARVGKSGGESACWLWAGCTRRGYGRVWRGGKMVLAHRVAYELLVGPIPEGLTLDHLCRNRACCNPNDLEPVTDRVNILSRHRAVGAERQEDALQARARIHAREYEH